MKEDNKDNELLGPLTEQYKLYVEMADRVSARRADANRFYVSFLTGLLALLSILVKIGSLASIQNFMIKIGSIGGIALCIIWFLNIRSYRQLNSGKFEVIHRMEEKLPFSCYKCEWDVLKNGNDVNSYFSLSKIEQLLPLLIALLFLILLLYVWIPPIYIAEI